MPAGSLLAPCRRWGSNPLDPRTRPTNFISGFLATGWSVLLFVSLFGRHVDMEGIFQILDVTEPSPYDTRDAVTIAAEEGDDHDR